MNNNQAIHASNDITSPVKLQVNDLQLYHEKDRKIAELEKEVERLKKLNINLMQTVYRYKRKERKNENT